MTTKTQLEADPTQYSSTVDRLARLLADNDGKLDARQARAGLSAVQRKHFKTNLNTMLDNDEKIVPRIHRLTAGGKPKVTIHARDDVHPLTRHQRQDFQRYFRDERRREILALIQSRVRVTLADGAVESITPTETTRTWLEKARPLYDVQPILRELVIAGCLSERTDVRANGRVVLCYSLTPSALRDLRVEWGIDTITYKFFGQVDDNTIFEGEDDE